MAVPAVFRAGACQFEIGLDKQQRENDIADTARQPDGNEQDGEEAKHLPKGYITGSVHQDVR